MISLCMIVKNEIKYIEDCLKCAQPYFDEIVVVDTGSTDGTLEVLEKFDCKIYHFEWCNDFAKARNFAISKATNDWCFTLDADEHIKSFDMEKVRLFTTNKNSKLIGRFKLTSYVGNVSNMEIDYLPRLFNKKVFRYERSIHEYLYPIGVFFNPKYVKLPIEANHYGYLQETKNDKKKDENYIETLKESIAKKQDPYLMKHLASCYVNVRDYPSAIAECDKIIDNKLVQTADFFPEIVSTKLKALLATYKFKEAAELEKYFDLCKDSDDYLYHIAYAYRNINQTETALDIYQYLINKPQLKINRLQPIFCIAEIMFSYELYEEALKWYKMLAINDDIQKNIDICEVKIAEQNNQ